MLILGLEGLSCDVTACDFSIRLLLVPLSFHSVFFCLLR